MICSVTDENLAEVKAFLEQSRETSLFLLSNLEAHGPNLSEELNSGNFKCLKSKEGLQAVFCLSRRGNLLVQAQCDVSQEILKACKKEEILIGGVLGEWKIAEGLWEAILSQDRSLQTTYQKKTLLHALPLSSPPHEPKLPDGISVRKLGPDDFEIWENLHDSLAAEEGLPLDGTREQRQRNFEVQAEQGYAWGLFYEDLLLSIAGYNARYAAVAQVGGVFTQPLYRRRGLSRAVMKILIRDSIREHAIDRLILFAGEENRGARKLYKSFGFEQIGFYGLLFGKRG